MTSRYPQLSQKEVEAQEAAQRAEHSAYITAKRQGRNEESATRIACVAYERTYRQTMNKTR